MTFNLARLYEILGDTTVQFRKGKVLEGTPELVDAVRAGQVEDLPGGTLEIFAMPHVDEIPTEWEKVDLEFITIGVDPKKAQAHRRELVQLLAEYPSLDRLQAGPGYIEVGGVLGDQGAALQLFALGEVLDLWRVITPTKDFSMTGADAIASARNGFLMIDGFRP